MAAVYTVFTSPNHAPIPNHLPTLIVTPHGQPSNVLYSYLHTNYNTENYLLTPSPQGDLCVAKLFPAPKPAARKPGAGASSDPGHGGGGAGAPPPVRCEASRNLKWYITNTGVLTPIYKLTLPSPDAPDLPLFQISKPNPNAGYWSLFYFAYAGHQIPPKRIEFGKIQKNPPGPGGGGTRISITGKTPEEKAVWQTLGEGNEDAVEWVVLCAALNLLDDEILKAAGPAMGVPPPVAAPGPAPVRVASPAAPPPGRAPVGLRDPGPVPMRPPPGRHAPSPGPPGPGGYPRVHPHAPTPPGHHAPHPHAPHPHAHGPPPPGSQYGPPRSNSAPYPPNGGGYPRGGGPPPPPNGYPRGAPPPNAGYPAGGPGRRI